MGFCGHFASNMNIVVQLKLGSHDEQILCNKIMQYNNNILEVDSSQCTQILMNTYNIKRTVVIFKGPTSPRQNQQGISHWAPPGATASLGNLCQVPSTRSTGVENHFHSIKAISLG